jgi:hypothetical protein
MNGFIPLFLDMVVSAPPEDLVISPAPSGDTSWFMQPIRLFNFAEFPLIVLIIFVALALIVVGYSIFTGYKKEINRQKAAAKKSNKKD